MKVQIGNSILVGRMDDFPILDSDVCGTITFFLDGGPAVELPFAPDGVQQFSIIPEEEEPKK